MAGWGDFRLVQRTTNQIKAQEPCIACVIKSCVESHALQANRLLYAVVYDACVCVCVCVSVCACVCVCVCVVIVHWHCSAQLSMFNMEKRYRNKIIIIIITIWTKGTANWVKWRGTAVAERGPTAMLHPIHVRCTTCHKSVDRSWCTRL